MRSAEARLSVHHDQQFHQVFVGRGAGALHHKNVARTHVLFDFDGHFAIGKPAHLGISQANVKVMRNVVGQCGIGIACKNHEIRGLIGLHGDPNL